MTKRTIETIYPLSPMQRGMLFHSLYSPTSGVYVEQLTCEIHGTLDLDIFEQAWQKVVERHQVLRASFIWEDVEEPIQVVQKGVKLPILFLDWQQEDPANITAKLNALLEQEKTEGFDLAQAPLMRFTIIQVQPEKYLVVWSNHHILMDGWSRGIVLQEVFGYYRAIQQGSNLRLRKVRPFRDYIGWLEQQNEDEQDNFWRDLLDGYIAPNPLNIDTSHAQPINKNLEGQGKRTLALGESKTKALLELAKQQKLTLSTLMQAAWGLLLSLYSTDNDVVFGVTVSGRSSPLLGIQSMVGLLINTIPLRLKIDTQKPLSEWLNEIHRQLAQSSKFEYTPLSRIQQLSSVPNNQSLFETILAFENYPVDPSTQSQKDGEVSIQNIQTYSRTNYPINVVIEPSQSLSIELLYDRQKFTDDAIHRLLEHLNNILTDMGANPEKRLGELLYLGKSERQQLLAWGQHVTEYPREQTLQSLFETQAQQYPNKIALVYEDQTMSYREVNERANQLAHYLRDRGVGRETAVGLCLERSFDMLIATLAVLKAGGVYVPIDPNYPLDRIQFILSDTRTPIILTQTHLRDNLLGHNIDLISLDKHWARIQQEKTNAPQNLNTPHDLAYIIYTSGSTGTPKGVSVTHQNVVRLVKESNYMAFGPEQTFLQFAPISFDAATLEIWGSLLNGSKLVIYPAGLPDLQQLGNLLITHQVSSLWLTAGLFHQMVEENLPALEPVRQLLAGGDVLSVSHVKQFLDTFPQNKLINGYGPTENTTFTTCHPMQQDSYIGTTVPIGRPIANTDVYILDKQMRLVPIGIPGDLYTGADGLSRGYFRRPSLTADKFIPNPYGTAGQRIYRTGDRARYLPDGSIEFLGRQDFQVKIRGFRIELGEIATILSMHPNINNVVLTAQDSSLNNKRLIAYYVSRDRIGPSVEELRNHLKGKLPGYMIPSTFIRLEAMPLTPNGKIDRDALPSPDLSQLSTSLFVAPRTPLEQTIADIWCNVLGVEKVGIQDNFFDLGGDSISSIKILSKIREQGLSLSMQQIFLYPTIESLVKEIRGQDAPETISETITPFALISEEEQAHLPNYIEDAYPVTQLQAGMLFHSEFGSPDEAVYHDVFSYFLQTKLDEAKWQTAVSHLIQTHPILRTTFDLTTYPQPLQLVHKEIDLPLHIIDLSGQPKTEQDNQFQTWFQQEKTTPIDWTKPPLLHFWIHKYDGNTFRFSLSFHHALLDGWSVSSMLTELIQHYVALIKTDQLAPIAPPITQFRQFVADEITALTTTESQNYWQGQVENISFTPLPRLYNSLDTVNTDPVVVVNVPIPFNVSVGLKNIAQQLGVPIKSILLAAHARVMSMMSGQMTITTGMVTHGRPEAEDSAQVLGLFLNTIPIYLNLQAGSWADIIQQAFHAEQQMLPHRHYPIAQIQKDAGNRPLFETVFNYMHLHSYQSLKPLEGLELLDTTIYGRTNFPLFVDFGMSIDNGQVTLSMTCDQTQLLPQQVQQLTEYYLATLTHLAEHPFENHRRHAFLSQDEQTTLLKTWQQTHTPYQRYLCIHELFQQQTSRTPDAAALSFEDKHYTYQELNAKANQLAHHLIAQGVTPDTPVAICTERSDEMMIGLLAILKAGGAYIPLDPNYPSQRLQFIMQDCGVQILLTQKRLLTDIPQPATVLCLDTEWTEKIAGQKESNPQTAVTSDNLAYIIHTSGSTGQPKGVMLSHRMVHNFFVGMDDHIGQDHPGVWLALTSISFDISVLELFWTLTRGYKVVIQGEEMLAPLQTNNPDQAIDFSLFYFASDTNTEKSKRYKLLMEGAKFADKNHFTAVWTPERHFHAFGGLYPNPSVAGAAVAAITQNIQIRAGSVVAPLHHPIRIAEEWSVVDNISQGRVGISFASGWHADDFLFQPNNFQNRKQIMFDHIETIRKLWQGESITEIGGAGNEVTVKIFPDPIQDTLPIWVTAAGNPETFRMAGEIGANVLTHLLGQSVEELAEKIKVYRQAWHEHGHDESGGHVSLMLHTFVGRNVDVVRQQVYHPFRDYLRSSIGLLGNLARSMGMDMKSAAFSDDDMESLLDHAFERYFSTSSLFGTPQTCLNMVDKLKTAGVDEVACLIDFGVEVESALSNFHYLQKLYEASNPRTQDQPDYSVAAQIKTHHVTHMQCTPSTARMLLLDNNTAQSLNQIDKLLLGGEALPLSLAQQLERVTTATVQNMYGPTETTIWSTTYRLPKPAEHITIGTPIANTQLYILDAYHHPVPIGVVGDLYIAGEGVARGYMKRPSLTASRFIPNKFSQRAGERLYQTGDKARYLPNGEIEFLGRGDFQVKVRGYRIELGEIETALNQHPAINQAVVTARTKENSEDARLVAYIIPSNGSVPAVTDLRAHLQKFLPDYMLPSAFVPLTEFPLTPNKKIDRRRLPEPDQLRPHLASNYVAPRNETEEQLCELWQHALDVEKVGIHDNFFELGGHSIVATQLITYLRQRLNIHIPLRYLFEAPTVAGLSERIMLVQQTAVAEIPPLTKRPSDLPIPLSFSQQRLWFLEQLEPLGASYTDYTAMRIHGELDTNILTQAINQVIQRHDSLRTIFALQDGQPVQLILPTLKITIPTIELQTLSADEREEQLHAVINRKLRQPFDLTNGPLVRMTLYKLQENEHVLLLTLHHIVSDGWSIGVIVGEINQLYEAIHQQKPNPLPPLPVQYADYAVWQRNWLAGDILEQQLNYWTQKLRGAPTLLELPTDNPRPDVQTFDGATQPLTIPADLTQAVRTLAQQTGVTPFMIVLAVFQLLLSRYADQEDVVVGAPISGRNVPETEPLVGIFINMLVFRTSLEGNPTFAELLERVRQTALEAYAHQELPFEKLVEAMNLERDMGYSPIFQVALNYFKQQPLPEVEFSGLHLSPMRLDIGAARFDLSLHLVDASDEMSGFVEYNTHLFNPATIDRFIQHFTQLLQTAVTHTKQPINTLSLFAQAEEKKILYGWNETAVAHTPTLIHNLIQGQAKVRPDHIAVVSGQHSLTYSQLDQRANQLAHHLIEQGIQPDHIIGLSLGRSLEMIIALLGIFKAGAAYLPLDPDYPQDRLHFMMEDAQIQLLITETALQEQLPTHKSPTLLIDSIDLSTYSVSSPSVRLADTNLAYIIYTSGSTGKPKGVALSHYGISNLAEAQSRTFNLQPKNRILQFSSLNFDASTFEIVMALHSGATLYLGQPDQFAQLLQEHHISNITVPPSVLSTLPHQDFPSLKTIVVAGEACPASLVRQWANADRRFFNAYGPTETTIWASVRECVADGKKPDIGKPIQNTQIYLLDRSLRPVPVGVPGELHIGGIGLARGYLARPNLTAQSFIPHPFTTEEGARLYKTGDLARYLPDGSIEFLGRIDHQVKLRGFRIELDEIQAMLESVKGISETAVLVHQPAPNVKRLVAYLVSDDDTPIDEAHLLNHLKQKLPDYMVPHHFIQLEQMPLTPNGKLDRRALPTPNIQQRASEEAYVAPQSDIEQELAQLWASILGLESVGIHDNFFALGGDSILSIQIVAQANEMGLKLSARQMFEHQTIAELAPHVTFTTNTTAEQEPLIGDVPLNHIQHWFLEQPLDNPHHWNQSLLLEIHQRLDAQLLGQALEAITLHHDALRLQLQTKEDKSWQAFVNDPAQTPSPFQTIDLSHLPAEKIASAIETEATQIQANTRLDQSPLLKAVLFELGEAQPQRLLLTIHHLAVDGVSWRILLNDVQRAYQQLSQEKPIKLPRKTTSIREWGEALHQYAQTPDIQESLTYWQTVLGEADGVLPVDQMGTNNSEADSQTVTVQLEAEETRALLQDIPATYQTQINDALLSALAQAIGQWTESTHTIVDLEGHGRETWDDALDLSRTVGWFTNLYPFVMDLSGVETAEAALKAVQEQREQLPHNGLSYSILRYISQHEALQEQPTADLVFNYLGQFDQALPEASPFEMASEAMGPMRDPANPRTHMIEVTSFIANNRLVVNWVYSQDFHDAETIQEVADNYIQALRNLIQDCLAVQTGDYQVSDFPLAHLSTDDDLDTILDQIEFEL